jgi:hypothetical protein
MHLNTLAGNRERNFLCRVTNSFGIRANHLEISIGQVGSKGRGTLSGNYTGQVVIMMPLGRRLGRKKRTPQ